MTKYYQECVGNNQMYQITVEKQHCYQHVETKRRTLPCKKDQLHLINSTDMHN